MANISSFVLFCGIYFNIAGRNVAAKSGPFVSTLVRAEKCAYLTQPYENDMPVDIKIQLYKMGKKTLLRGNYTAYKPVLGAKLTIQDYFLVNDQWRMTFRVVGMTCRSRIVATMGQIFGIRFNKKTCAIPKGIYVFNNIDYDVVDHVFLIDREYGRMLRKVEVFRPKGTTVCLEMEVLVTPKNK